MPAWLPTPLSFTGGTSSIVAGPWSIFLVFLKLGCVVFGSGYVLLAFLQADLVAHRHWLSDRQLLDAVAVGQVTPGPVFTTATFIGYLIGGGRGAIVATVGIFAPAFLLVAATGPLIHRIRQSRAGASVLDALNAASLGLMAAVTLSLGRAAITDILTAILAVAGVVLLFRFRFNSAWLIVGGAIAGLAALLVGR
jgi:chromate transporter